MTSLFETLRAEPFTELIRRFVSSVPETEDESYYYADVAGEIARRGREGRSFLLANLDTMPDHLHRRAIIFGIGDLDADDEVDRRIAEFLVLPDDPMVVAEAITTLRAHRCDSAADVVTQLLSHVSPFVRARAIEYLTALQIDGFMSALRDGLRDPDSRVKCSTLDAIGDYDVRGFEAEILQLKTSPDPDVREAARYAGDVVTA